MCPPGDPERQFVSADALNTVWLYREGRSASRLDLFHKQLTAAERDPGINERYLKLLSVLVWIQYPYEAWREFAKTFPELSISDRQGWQDDKFPFQDAKPLHALFESEIDFDTHGQSFLRNQYLFSPARIHELPLSDSETGIRPLPDSMRLPFLDAGKLLHHGTHKVTRRKVAKGEIQTLNGEPLPLVAVKTFSPDQKRQFLAELYNLKLMKKAPLIHPNIQSCFSAIQIGSTGHLIFEPAECNLSQILHWQDTFSASFCEDIRRDLRPSYLLWEAKDLSDALDWLHNGFRPRMSSDIFRCYHLDLKPDNILVFPPTDSAVHGDIWMWKIADFGGSAIKNMRDIAQDNPDDNGPAIATIGRLRTGVYQAPEIESREHEPGTAADIWSYGCILLEILAFAHGGPGGVKRLEGVRNGTTTGRSHFYDSTFALRADIRSWIDELEIFDEGLCEFREQIYRLLHQDPAARPNAQDLKRPFEAAWDKVSKGTANGLIFPTPSKAPTSDQAADVDIPIHDPALIRLKDGPQQVDRPVSNFLRKTPSMCRMSTTGDCAIVQVKSERNYSAFGVFPEWNETSIQEPRSLLEGEEPRRYSVEKIAAQGTVCAALLRTVGSDEFQLLLCSQDKRTFHSSSKGTELSVSAHGDCIVHNDNSLKIFLSGCNHARELILPGTLKGACFSNDGKWVYVWSRTDAMDYWQIFDVTSGDPKPFLQLQRPFLRSHHPRFRNLLIALRDPSEKSSIRPLFLTIDKHGNANALISNGNAFYVHSIQGEFSGYDGGAATEDGRSILLVHQSQANRTPDLHLVDLDPEKLRTTDPDQPLVLRYDELEAPYLRDYMADTGFSISSEESNVYAYFAIKFRGDIVLKRVHVGGYNE
ncbi:cmgc mapk protein kinase [Diplodia corticola]|uniref:Cmgc mapk protein kinase n=1 Tax=Diplodia corticola TaxID=236234 RepID=A0A1J9RFV3_9PEZI|nr:cmgc mapk protein kinase [Diplodia corticola]OJD38962.1 cmgc mapk protein kinase [Diplodia corticola]